MYPLILRPLLQSTPWGGDRLAAYGRVVPAGSGGRSREIFHDADGSSPEIANGPWAGRRLAELVEEQPEALIGTRHKAGEPFPLSVSFLDTASPTAIIVHPDERAAELQDADAKTETLFIVEAEPGAQIWAGLRPDKLQHQFVSRIGTDDLISCLKAWPVQAGDACFIPAGRVHCIGGGILGVEISQNSASDWRLHDWNRPGLDGDLRPLHLEQGLAATNFKDRGLAVIRADVSPVARNKRQSLSFCRHFTVERIRLVEDFYSATIVKSFQILINLGDDMPLRYSGGELILTKGTTVLLPASIGPYSLHPVSQGEILRAALELA